MLLTGDDGEAPFCLNSRTELASVASEGELRSGFRFAGVRRCFCLRFAVSISFFVFEVEGSISSATCRLVFFEMVSQVCRGRKGPDIEDTSVRGAERLCHTLKTKLSALACTATSLWSAVKMAPRNERSSACLCVGVRACVNGWRLLLVQNYINR